jgi:hypothetical protein
MLNAVDGVQPRVNTAEMLLELFEEDPSREFTAAEAEELLTARGWSTESKDKVNAVRASLVRLKNAGDLESVGRGTYRLHRDQSDDPWGNAPIRTSEADDEPPF